MSSEQIITPHPVGRVSPEGVTRQLADDAENTNVGLRDKAANPTYGDDWSKITLGVFAEINPKRTISKGAMAPFIEMAALRTFSRDVDVADVVEKPFTGGGAKFTNGDTLLARITPCLENGKTSLVSCLSQNTNGYGSTEFIVLAPRFSTDKDFLYYLARCDEFRAYAISRMEGTSGRQRVPNSAVAQFTFICPPPKEERKQIGDFLACLDDRIALLRETNATLEAIAQALFKSWFVDFDPVRAKQEGRAPEGMSDATAALFPDSFEESAVGLVPRGWKSMPLERACEINPTRRISKGAVTPYLEMAAIATKGHRTESPVPRAFSSGTKFINGDTLLARITPCLENGKTAFVDFLNGEDIGWGSTEYIVLNPKQPLPSYWAYLLCRHEPFRQFAIQAMVGTSGRQRVDVSRLSQYLVTIPDEPVSKAFAGIVESLQRGIAANAESAQTLSTLRDTLLPRLISGKLRLPKAEAGVTHAG